MEPQEKDERMSPLVPPDELLAAMRKELRCAQDLLARIEARKRQERGEDGFDG